MIGIVNMTIHVGNKDKPYASKKPKLVKNSIFFSADQVRMTVNGNSAMMIKECGNHHVHVKQEIACTVSALGSITLYACWDGDHWAIMLPGEY